MANSHHLFQFNNYAIDGTPLIPPPETITYFESAFNTPQKALFQKVLTGHEGQSLFVDLSVLIHRPQRLNYQLIDELGQIILDKATTAQYLHLPVLAMGYYILRFKGRVAQDWQIIIAPPNTYQSPILNHKKVWGFSTQLYALRSERNWGIGDFQDLADFMEKSASFGASFVGVNPLHELFMDNPQWCSPYSPTSRKTFHYLYLAIDKIPEFHHSEFQLWFRQEIIQEQLKALRESVLIDYSQVALLKLTALKLLFRLQTNELNFEQWLQNQIQQQLAPLKALLPLGLYLDLAVGCARNGRDVQNHPNLYFKSASIGAPPDPLGPVGQNWELPPINPEALEKSGFTLFIEILRANMKHAGILRIDHIMGLYRQWLIPENKNADAGIYVLYPVEALFALLAIESQRHQCVIIGEDLGTVPNEVREKLHQYQIYSYEVLYFARQNDEFPKGQNFKTQVLATIGTHDLPSLLSYWHCGDIELFKNLNILSDEIIEQKYHQRLHDKQALLNALYRDGYLPPHYSQDNALTMGMHQHLIEVIHRYFSESACRLLAVQPENLLNMNMTFNLPGTIDEYPNWRQKYTLNIIEFFNDSNVQKVLKEIEIGRNQE